MLLYLILAAMAAISIIALHTSFRLEYRFLYANRLIAHDMMIRYLCFSHKVDLMARVGIFPHRKKRQHTKRKGVGRLSIDYTRLMYQAVKHTTIVEPELVLSVGYQDAYVTAMILGVLQSILYGFIAILPIREKEDIFRGIQVRPEYQRDHLEFSVHCIAKISLVNIISAAWHAIVRTKKRS